MTQSVVFSTCSRISCAGQSSPEVVICLDSDELLTSGRSSLDGVLTRVYKDNNCCETVAWRYVIAYDETLLVDPDTLLVAADINGIFCKGCLTTWVEDEFATSGNLLLVTDTDSVDLTINGTLPQTLSADVNISADGGNTLEIRDDGLYTTGGGGGGGISRTILSVSSATAVGSDADTDYVYFVTGTTTLTMPAAAGNTNRYSIKRTGVGTVTIASGSGDTFDGSGSITLLVQYASVDLISDGNNWFVI